ncbi:hypothetical protein BKA67DRAFT_159830 [Truncatella angustata]|uniref:Uncharacterized protein n=1 Tax=Truncatella angustata TaxID=152316 RepID=A0A9P9A010_9PEZI|nr:uncharacterized protein BKA67DRAFT_159830 [Truncatella angustata]KAH6656584.1 hypothetical protein BKA67DRAFT_159830 [Truncatella angustata]
MVSLLPACPIIVVMASILHLLNEFNVITTLKQDLSPKCSFYRLHCQQCEAPTEPTYQNGLARIFDAMLSCVFAFVVAKVTSRVYGLCNSKLERNLVERAT